MRTNNDYDEIRIKNYVQHAVHALISLSSPAYCRVNAVDYSSERNAYQMIIHCVQFDAQWLCGEMYRQGVGGNVDVTKPRRGKNGWRFDMCTMNKV